MWALPAPAMMARRPRPCADLAYSNMRCGVRCALITVTSTQGLTLVHFSAQRKHYLWDTFGTFSRQMGHKSSQTGHKTAHWPEWLRLS